MDIHTIGIDLGKTVFHLVGLNVRGEVVNVLADGSYGAGVQSVVWRGDDRRGQMLRTGVYFYRIEATSISGGRFVKRWSTDASAEG